MEDEIMELVETEMRRFYNGLVLTLCRASNLSEYAEDAHQVARVALWKAASSWDPIRNEDFGKASYLRVRGAVIDFLRTIGGYNRYRKWAPLHTSIDIPLAGTDSLMLRDVLPDDSENAEAALVREQLPPDWEARLDERSALLLRLYYWDELPMREIAELLGINESRVSQLTRKALEYLEGCYGIKDHDRSGRGRWRRRNERRPQDGNRCAAEGEERHSATGINRRGRITHIHWHTRQELASSAIGTAWSAASA